MKKAIIILCTLLLLALTGCSRNQSNTTSANQGQEAGNQQSAAAVTNTPFVSSESLQPTGTPAKNQPETTSIHGVVSDYEVVRTSYNKNTKDIQIFYPQLKGLSDPTKQATINDILRNTALASAEGDMVNLDYTTMWTSHNLLSVQFYGGFYEEGAAHPNSVIYTVNVDMKTGDLIKLPDLIDVKHDFIQLFMDKSQLVDGRGAGSDYESIKGDFFKAEDLTYSFDENAAFYFTSTGIVFTVGTIHAIGDYALFRLNFSDLSNYMKQTKQWGDIQSDFTSSEFQIIRDQSFKTTLPGFGSTWFISGFEQSSNDIINSLKFYLLDDNGHVKYTFPDYNSSSLGYYGIRAVSFNDVNHDGQKDVIIIAALHQNGQVEVDEAKVYLSDGDHFTMDNEFNSSLSKNLKATKTVSDVLGAAKSYYK